MVMNAQLSAAGFRKLYALLIAGAISFVLQRMGVDASEFGAEGPIVQAMVDFLMDYGVPAVFATAATNQIGDSIVRYWRWIVGGLGIVGGLMAVLIVLSRVL
jgi:hypothetical protein